MQLFPIFKTIELVDLKGLQEHIYKYPPYNEFSPIDLWIYGPEGTNKATMLNDNLVIKRQSYINDSYYYSILGKYDLLSTINQLYQYINNNHEKCILSHIPEIVIESCPELNHFYNIKEDIDNYDYILTIKEIAEFHGKKYYDKRNLVNRFYKKYKDAKIISLDINKEENQKKIINLFDAWAKNKNKNSEEIKTELDALTKFFTITSLIPISCIGIEFNNELIGYATYHQLHDKYAGMSFQKGDIRYDGVYSVLNHEVCKILLAAGFEYLNYEQDLGIDGLRKSKSLWHPIKFLKKFIITQKTNPN